MIIVEYKGHILSNAVSAIVKYYPKVSGGRDLIKDVKENPESLSTMGYLYAAFRMAGDASARNLSPDDLLNEIDYDDFREPASEFYKCINKLMDGESGNSKNV